MPLLIDLSPDQLRHRLQALAMLDAILMPAWEYRYFSFDSTWGDDETLGSARDGSGDQFFAHFSPAGVFVMGFEHERPTDQTVFDGLPAAFDASKSEPAFETARANLCAWHDGSWHQPGAQSNHLLQLALAGPQAYVEWASEYYEQPVTLAAVTPIFELQPFSGELAQAVNPAADLEELPEDVDEIGYPVARSSG